ncbi:MAG: hypothetical protein ABSA47_12695 [Verrucomicrobiota bacterium]
MVEGNFTDRADRADRAVQSAPAGQAAPVGRAGRATWGREVPEAVGRVGLAQAALAGRGGPVARMTGGLVARVVLVRLPVLEVPVAAVRLPALRPAINN